ncbi:hypothetical protein L1606_01815 [Streptomyces spororaveus]|uniref:hypothetical protein n=1 Tax=Streptomyces spororaveus TaxID=284039 RepID=UPI0020792E46|nr:hypothetical protein [Streptomyces spororaveus]MCM9076850.1 hypothetical protein [Streptomyces spororaveus]
MIRTSRKQRFAMVAVSGAFVAGGILLPGTAFAAPHAPETVSATVHRAGYENGGHQDKGREDHRGERKGHHDRKNRHDRNGKVRDVDNMPGCKFYQGKVYCEHQPNPAPMPAPAPKPDPVKAEKDNPDHVPNV